MNRAIAMDSLPTLAATRRRKPPKTRQTPASYAARVVRICSEEFCEAVIIPDSDFGVRTIYGPGHAFDRHCTHNKNIIGVYTGAADPQALAEDIGPYWVAP